MNLTLARGIWDRNHLHVIDTGSFKLHVFNILACSIASCAVLILWEQVALQFSIALLVCYVFSDAVNSVLSMLYLSFICPEASVVSL